jgi:hypothetical protein
MQWHLPVAAELGCATWGTEEFTWVARHRLFHSSVGHMLRVKPGDHVMARLVSGRGKHVPRQDYTQEVMRMHKSFQHAQSIREAIKAQR